MAKTTRQNYKPVSKHIQYQLNAIDTVSVVGKADSLIDVEKNGTELLLTPNHDSTKVDKTVYDKQIAEIQENNTKRDKRIDALDTRIKALEAKLNEATE